MTNKQTLFHIQCSFLLFPQPLLTKRYFLAHPTYLDDEMEGIKDIGGAYQQPGPVVVIISFKKNNKRGNGNGKSHVDHYTIDFNPSF